MNNYSIVFGDEDGERWTIRLKHKELFDDIRFDVMVEEAINYAFEDAFKMFGYINERIISPQTILFFLQKTYGFEDNLTQMYEFNEFNFPRIKNERLKQWLNRCDDREIPYYLKDKNEQESN